MGFELYNYHYEYSSWFNPTLSLPQSSSTLPNLSHNDTYGIEESDTHHNNRGDIAE